MPKRKTDSKENDTEKRFDEASSPHDCLPEKVRKILVEIEHKFKAPFLWKITYEEILSEEGRTKFKSYLDENYLLDEGSELYTKRKTYHPLLHFLMDYYQCPHYHTLVIFGAKLELLTDNKKKWLLSEISRVEKYKGHLLDNNFSKPWKLKPSWDPQTGTLWFDQKQIRKVRVKQVPSNIQIILNSFEVADWNSSIPFPIIDMENSERHKLVNEINSRMDVVRFHLQSGANQIYWQAETGV